MQHLCRHRANEKWPWRPHATGRHHNQVRLDLPRIFKDGLCHTARSNTGIAFNALKVLVLESFEHALRGRFGCPLIQFELSEHIVASKKVWL
jgi:hypothetical protein